LVEYGVARFGDIKKLVTDEPLALLAAIRYFEKTAWSLRYFLNEALTQSYAGARGVALEHFGAYIFALAFNSPRRLGEVFEFVGSNDLEQETGHLVAVHKQKDGKFVAHPVNITSDALPTYILGRSPSDARQTLSWLEDPGRTVFCFPAHIIKPDLILLLQLSDTRLLRVLVQFKQMPDTISRAETLKASESVNPRSMNSRSDETPEMNRYALVLIHLPNVSPSEQRNHSRPATSRYH
jgi:hypothetical protein